MSFRDENLRQAIGLLHLILVVERFYEDEEEAIKVTIEALGDKLR